MYTFMCSLVTVTFYLPHCRSHEYTYRLVIQNLNMVTGDIRRSPPSERNHSYVLIIINLFPAF